MDNGYDNNNRDIPENNSSGNSPEGNLQKDLRDNWYRVDSTKDKEDRTSQPSGRDTGAPVNNSEPGQPTSERGNVFVNRNQSASGVYSAQQSFYGNPQGEYTSGNRQNPGAQYGNGYYRQQQYQQYRPQNQNPYEPHNGFGGGYGYTAQPPQSPNSLKKEKRGASKGFVIGMVALGMVICLLIGAFSAAAYYEMLGNNVSKPAGSGSVIVQHESSGETPVITDKGDAAYVASVAANSVVEVTTETVSTDSYFGQYVTQGAGSGVIISSGDEGTYIITCAHVIEGATTVKVTLKDGTQYESSFTASDSQTDIGIIKINVSGLSAVTIADFSQVVVGEGVVAIGNPLGELGGSVTNGIVSALDRDIIIDGTAYHLLQTNAEINPGNSGGGLFNMEGKLIGIVNAKSSGDNVEGLGFAIPIDEAMKVAKELIENGYVTGRVKLGFSLIEVQSQEDVYYWWKYSKYFTDYGVYIIESESDDFYLGDRIVAINSITVSSTSDIKNMLLDFEVGETVTVTVSRLNSKNQSEIFNIDLVLTEVNAK